MKDLILSSLSSCICSAALRFSETCLLKLDEMAPNWRFLWFLEANNLQVNQTGSGLDLSFEESFLSILDCLQAQHLEYYIFGTLSWSVFPESKIIPQPCCLTHLSMVLAGVLCCHCVWERSSSRNLETAWSAVVGFPHVFCHRHASFPGYQLQGL